MIIQTPGIYKNIPNEDYHASKGISNSGMGLILDCPKLYWHQYLSGKYQRKQSDDYKIGSAVHTLCLEPETFKDRFHIVNEIPKRVSKIGKAEHAAMVIEAGSRDILDSDEYEQIAQMANSITSHAMFNQLKRKGNIEDSIMWTDPDSGALLRTRPDYYDDFLIVDIKTTKDPSPSSFSKAIFEYGYHRQGAMACDGLTELTGQTYDMVVLFVVSKQPPYLRKAYVLTAQALEEGRREYKRGAAIYQECINSGIWSGYPEIIEDINLPAWAYRRNENE